jgi:peptidoglycan/xylan/chitin deacetylase (PgdA/CDA1 family)
MIRICRSASHKLLALLIIPLLVLPAMRVQEVAAQGEEVRLPILMYHQLTQNRNLECKHCITVAQLKKDLDWLIDHGYQTVSMAQVIDFCTNGTPLPPKPVVISFDDGFESFYAYAFPLLKEREMCAVLAIIGAETDRFSNTQDHRLKYSSCTWEQLEELCASGLVELASHSWSLHTESGGRKGAAKMPGESIEEYRRVLTRDVEKMRAALLAHGLPDFVAYAYPYGAYSTDSGEILSSLGVQAAFICDSRVNILHRGSTIGLMELKRFNRAPGSFCLEE